MSENEELLVLANGMTPFDLPVGVYVVTKDGRFVRCNPRAREIFRFPPEGDVEGSIERFYRDPARREELHDKLLRLEAGGCYLEEILTFEVNGREVFVRESARSLRGAGGEVLGLVCCMTDVTEGERSNRLLDALPAGVYRLDAEDRCEKANKAFARILGYDSPDEIEGHPSSDFYVNPQQAAELRRLIEQRHPEPVNNFIAELRRKDGETIFVNINAHMVVGDDGGYAGREGTLIDVTREENYRRILRDVPVGLNVIRHDDDRDVIVDCNEQFLRLFDFPDAASARGFDARRLHASATDYARFRSELELAARLGHPVVGRRLPVVTLGGERLTVEISSRPLTDSEGNVVGRTGAVRDITQEAELRDRLDELTYDFGNVLHNYTTTLLMVQLSVDPVIRSLAPDPFPEEKEVTPEQAGEAVAGPGARLAEALAPLLAIAREEERAAALPGETPAQLAALAAVLRGDDGAGPVLDFRAAVFGEAALSAVDICDELARSHKFPREKVKAARAAARELLRVTNLISLHQMRDAVREMDHQVRSLREFVTSNAREPEPRAVCQVSELIRQARHNLEDYARSRHVEIKIERGDARVRVVRREVLRALTNLLHNAIKYSWSRDKTRSPWITVRVLAADGAACVQFENWGVAIPKDEIEQELIFKIGYRGRLSGDRGRIGTGIGLADARRVARAHRGDVIVESRPAVGSRPETDYTQPFVTTVTLKLPLYAE